MHSIGVAKFIKAFIGSTGTPLHPLAAAHLAVSIAAWLPFPGRQKVQHDCLDPHFL